MIKELGTLGFFIKFNESASAALKFVEIFSSSAATTSLFSASTNSSNVVSLSAPSTMYVNGYVSSSVTGLEWNHVMFSFNPKLYTDSTNNFIVRFGNLTKGDFNIQNVYILDSFLTSNDALMTHIAFVGNYIGVSASSDTSSVSLVLVDKDEQLHSSSTTVYQPVQGQKKFRFGIRATASSSLSTYVTNDMLGDAQFIDGVKLNASDYILSIIDNKVYQLSSNNKLVEITTADGDYVNVLSGRQFKNRVFTKSSGSFIDLKFVEKVVYLGTQS